MAVSGGIIALLVLGGLVLLVVVWLVATYNGLIRRRNQVENAWAQIDVQLKRRHDLIPNLVETAKGYMEHERETLEEVTRARNLAQQASGPGQASQAEEQLSSALGQFFLVVERYPDLKANQNFLALQEELTSTENKIGFARQFYNDQVMNYNTRIQSFPVNVVAGMFNFTERDMFELEAEAEREAPEVSF
ncbi:MAG: LemA family protein [Candidatus Brocadiia bacterium]